MRVRVGYKVIRDILAEEDYYAKLADEEVAKEIIGKIRAAIRHLAKNQDGKHIEDMPKNYWRVSVPPFHLYYRIARRKGCRLVFLLRYQRRRDLAPSTLKHLASEAERGSVEFS